MLCVTQFHWKYYKCGSILSFLHAVAAAVDATPGKDMSLDLSHWPLFSVDNESVQFATPLDSPARKVFENLTSLRLNFQQNVFSDLFTNNDPIGFPDRAVFFVDLMCGAQKLKTLKLDGFYRLTAPLMRTLAERAYWPCLEELTLIRAAMVSGTMTRLSWVP